MHRILSIAILWTIGLSASISQAQLTYTPLGRWIDPQVAACRNWELGRQAIRPRAPNALTPTDRSFRAFDREI